LMVATSWNLALDKELLIPRSLLASSILYSCATLVQTAALCLWMYITFRILPPRRVGS
jgi:hypothetical protein